MPTKLTGTKFTLSDDFSVNRSVVSVSTPVSVRAFGAVGDGVADDTAAIQEALDSGASVFDGGGLTYKISAALNGRSDIVLRDFNIDATALGSSTYAFSFVGADGTPQTLAADYAEGVFGMTVPDGTAFTVDGWAFLASDEYWSAAASDNVKYGEFVQIASITGNVLTFGGSTLLKYEQAATATITPVAMLENIRCKNVHITGPVSTGNQGGFLFNRCRNVVVQDCDTNNLDFVHVYFRRSVRCTVRGGSASRTGAQEGLDYGVSVTEGCHDVIIDGYRGDALRHIVTIGGSQGVSRHISVVNCRGLNLTDAGIDSHSAVHEHLFADNFLHFSDDADVTIEGILVAGTSPVVRGNQIYNCKRHGIAWQPEVLTAFTGRVSAIIADNVIDQKRDTGSTSGVLVSPVDIAGLREIDAVTIRDNHIGGFRESVRIITSGAVINNVAIHGTQTMKPTRGRSLHINAADGDVVGLDISGGHYETDSITTASVIDLAATSPSLVKNWRVRGVNMKRGSTGTVGLRLENTSNGYESGNTVENVSVKYSVDAASTGITLDRTKSSVKTHSVSAAYTVLPQDEHIIVNRAATVTLTLPGATLNAGRTLFIKTIQAQEVVSASSNVAPIGDSTAGTAILPATDGAWSLLKSDGTSWVVMQRGT